MPQINRFTTVGGLRIALAELPARARVTILNANAPEDDSDIQEDELDEFEFAPTGITQVDEETVAVLYNGPNVDADEEDEGDEIEG